MLYSVSVFHNTKKYQRKVFYFLRPNPGWDHDEYSYTCVRALHFELELEVIISQKSRKKEPCSARTKTNKNSSHIWCHIRDSNPGHPDGKVSLTFAQNLASSFLTDSKIELYRQCGHNRLKGWNDWINLGFGKLPTYPSPQPTSCPKWEVSDNVGLGEG